MWARVGSSLLHLLRNQASFLFFAGSAMFKALVPVASVRIHSCLNLCGRARSFGTDLKDNMKQGKVTTMPILPEQHKDTKIHFLLNAQWNKLLH